MTNETATPSETQNMREVVEQYAALTDGWFWESDDQHRITYVSRGVEEIVGSPPEFFYGLSRTEFSIASSIDPECWKQHLDDLKARRPIRGFTYSFSGPKGERWIRIDGNPIFAKDGRFTGYRGIASDVTEQINQENSVEMLAAAVDEFPSPVCVWAADNTLAWFNSQFVDSFSDLPTPIETGLPYNTFITELAENRLAWKEAGQSEDWIRQRVEAQGAHKDKAIVRLKDGRTFRLVKRALANGSTVALSVDISDLLSAQEEAQSARQKLTEALNALDTPFAYYDAEDRLQNWNDAFTDLNFKIKDLLKEGVRFEELLDAIIERGQVSGIEGNEEKFRQERLELHRQSNTRTERLMDDGRWFAVREVSTGDGGIVGIWTDISALKKQQAELEHARQEAETASRLKSGFLANISHELRTPLNSIGGFIHLLSSQDLGDQERELLNRISLSTETLITLVNDLLDLSLAEAGELHVVSSEFSISETLDDVVRIMEPAASVKGLSFETRIGPGVPAAVLGDRKRLRQILLNLADNAIKFAHKGGIKITAHLDNQDAPRTADNTGILFEVQDTGIGISQDALDNVFMPFFQGDVSSTREFGGAGLGLSISKKLADLMGGSIDIESTVGRGTNVRLNVPLPIFRKTGRKIIPDSAASPPPDSLSGAKILLVDDQSLNRQVLRSVLTKAGCTVYEAVDGEEAVNITSSSDAHFFDAILMDIQMPKMDGLTATKAILAAAKGNAPPIIALTAHTMESERRKCIAAGMCDHLEKPVDPEKLCTTLVRWTSGRREDVVQPSLAGEAKDGKTIEPQQVQADESDAPSAASYETLVHQLADAIEDEELARELLIEFANTYGNAAAQLRTLLDTNEVPAAKDFAHRLKGVSGNLRLIELHDAAMRLEARLTNTPDQSEELYEALETLGTIHSRIVDSIHASAAP